MGEEGPEHTWDDNVTFEALAAEGLYAFGEYLNAYALARVVQEGAYAGHASTRAQA